MNKLIHRWRGSALSVPLALIMACGGTEAGEHSLSSTPSRVSVGPDDRVVSVTDTMLPGIYQAMGIAEPHRSVRISTKLMGTVEAVLVQEGDRVRAGQPLVRLDGGELGARRRQVEAALAAATAVYDDAMRQESRMRRLYADSAAPKAMLEAAELGRSRAEAGLESARGALAELEALEKYRSVTAPFSGIIVRRLVDPGAFAAPGTPLVELQDPGTLRIRTEVPATVILLAVPGERVDAEILGQPVSAEVEGVVSGGVGNGYIVNALVRNDQATYPSGVSASLRLAAGAARSAVLIPREALVSEGDLLGVTLVAEDGTTERRWVRTGRTIGPMLEVVSGLMPGDRLLLPSGGR